MDKLTVLRALADDNRLRIVRLLLEHNFCVRALSRQLGISEAAVSQHLKILREAGLLGGEKKSYFVHYTVNREVLLQLAGELEQMAAIQRVPCSPGDHPGGACG